MTLTALNGLGFVIADDYFDDEAGPPAFGTGMLIDDSAERGSMIGRVWHPDTKTGTIAIRKVHFRAGAVTQGILATSTFRVSLQNVSATAGPPYQPDATQDQTGDFVGGTNAVTANDWNITPALSADRTVDLSASSIGDTNSPWVAVVFEWSAFVALDSVVVNTLNQNNLTSGYGSYLAGRGLFFNGTSYSVLSGTINNIALELSDGTFAFLGPAVPIKTITTVAISTSVTARAAGLFFQVPVQLTIDRIGLKLILPNGCDGTLTLYDSDGTTVLAAVTVDNDAVSSATTASVMLAHIPPVTLTAATNYRLVWVPANTTSATLSVLDVHVAGIMDGLVGGQEFHYTERDLNGAWAQTTTRRPIFYIGVQKVHDGSGGGGVLTSPGMSGGMRG